jgi:hypothetical protein
MMEDQSAKQRFPIELPLTLTWDNERLRKTGSGTVVEISSDRLLFLSQVELPPLTMITASIAWPIPLEGGCRLQLVVTGPAMVAGENTFQMRIDQYVFRTAARAGNASAAPPALLTPEVPQRRQLV